MVGKNKKATKALSMQVKMQMHVKQRRLSVENFYYSTVKKQPRPEP